MTHHWRPSDHLERSPQPGVWLLVRRGARVGSVEYGRVRGQQAFRGVTAGGDLVGYAWSIERACDRLWDWSVRTARGGIMTLNLFKEFSTQKDLSELPTSLKG